MPHNYRMETDETQINIWQIRKSTIYCFIIWGVIVFILICLGSWFHCNDETHQDTCQTSRKFGCYCEDSCLYGNLGPGPGLWFFLLLSIPFIMVVQCIYDKKKKSSDRDIRVFVQ